MSKIRKRKGADYGVTAAYNETAHILVTTYSQLEKNTGKHYQVDYDTMLTKPNSLTNDDWIIVKLVQFFHEVELLYTSCSLFCTSDTCPMFNAGPQYMYFWDDVDAANPIQVSAPEYFTNLKRFIKRNLQDPTIIPNKSGTPLDENQLNVIKACYRRLFRILAHLYVCHFQTISAIKDPDAVEVMNSILIRYTKFAIDQKLIEYDDVKMLNPVFQAINKEAGKDLCPKDTNE